MWVVSFSSLSGSSTVDCFPVFPRAFSGCHGSLSWVSTLPVWSSGLLAPRCLTPPSLCTSFARFVTFWRLCVASWGPPLFPNLLRHFLARALAALPFLPQTAGLASMDGPRLVSSAEAQLCELPSHGCTTPVSWLRGVFSRFARLPYFSR